MKRLLAVALLSIALIGCSDPYGSSVKAGADIANGIATGMQTVGALQRQGTITAPQALNVLGYLEFANKGDEAFLTCAQTAHTNGNKAGTYTACAQAFNSTLNTPAELALVKLNGNAAAAQTVNTIVNGITSAAQAIITGLGGA